MVRPDPIPNSAVKHSLADGSSPIGSARVGSRQFFNKNPEMILRGFAVNVGQHVSPVSNISHGSTGSGNASDGRSFTLKTEMHTMA